MVAQAPFEGGDILTSPLYTDPRTKDELEQKSTVVDDYESDEKRYVGSVDKEKHEKHEKEGRRTRYDDLEGVEGLEWERGDEQLEAKGDDDDPEYASIPQIVRELVDFEDDTSTPILTWRFYFLSGIFTALGAWLTQMSYFRTTSIPYSIYFVQIASLYFGRLLAGALPKKTIGRGRFSFELNPGPFSVKEHVAIVLAANTGATNNLGDYVLAPLYVYYDAPMNGWLAILFMWSCVFVGFSYASFARKFLIEDPKIVFPLTLQQVALFRSMRDSFEYDSATNKKQMRVFWYGILAFFVWQFLPEYVAPLLSSLTILCWVSSNPNVTFAGSGLGGAGFLNITLDWSNIGSSVIYQPWWVQTNVFAASVLGVWILIPVGWYTGAFNSDLYPIRSFERRTNYFFSYVAYLGTFVSLALFQGPLLWKTAKAQYRGEKLHRDRLNVIMDAYPTVPWTWNVVLFIVPVGVLTGLTVGGTLCMPVYALYIGPAFGAAIVLPMGYIYSVSGYSVSVGYFNEIVYGYIINLGGSRHPVGSLSYRVISGQAWYEAQSMLSDMKASPDQARFSFRPLGHYFHIPPRAVLWAQVWGILIGVPINYATIMWICTSKADFLTGKTSDPNKQWTGQTVISLNNQGIQFALVGPKRLFADPAYQPMLYGFVVGAVAPFLLYGLHRTFPRAKFNLFSLAIFGSAMESFHGNISTGFFTKYILGSVNYLYLRRHKYEFWKTYAYIFGAAADTGLNLNMLIIFLAFSAGKTVTMPHWFGNNAISVERCFPRA
ncbi:OPT oligopeptide transporter protein-domain-containing protein [Mrakia frigida]|uniref:OPT family oligopeptide transporter n=1 Tax=Mrakia frigida TaxID=29902 RepID=UPI003FCC0992